jgi:hypothetical protein
MIHEFNWSDKERLVIKRLHIQLSKATGYGDQQKSVQEHYQTYIFTGKNQLTTEPI